MPIENYWLFKKPLRLSTGIVSRQKNIGYGRVQAHLIDALEAAGGIEIIPDTSFDWDYRLLFGWPKASWMGRDASDVIYHTMWEFEQLPEGWIDALNRCRLVWLPSNWCADVFINHGLKAPYMVSGYGIWEADFPIVERQSGPPVFIIVAHSLTDRKGALDVLRNFIILKEKGELKDARLIIKVQTGIFKTLKGRDDILYCYGPLKQTQYAKLLGQAHCLIYPHHGEGFGFIPLEFACTGGIAFVNRYAGCTEYIDEKHIFELDGTDESIQEAMKWVADNLDVAMARGREAARWVRERFTWAEAGYRARRLLYYHLGG